MVDDRKSNCYNALCCCLRRKDDSLKQSKKHKTNHSHHKKKTQTDERYYQETDFKNRFFEPDNFMRFWDYYKKGIEPVNNLVAQMASVSIFAFIDKEGIVTEAQKYAAEVILLNEKADIKSLKL